MATLKCDRCGKDINQGDKYFTASAFYGSDFYSNGMFVAISQYTPELVEKFREGEFNDQELSWPQL